MKAEKGLNLTEEVNLHTDVTQQGRSPLSPNCLLVDKWVSTPSKASSSDASSHHLSFLLLNSRALLQDSSPICDEASVLYNTPVTFSQLENALKQFLLLSGVEFRSKPPKNGFGVENSNSF